VKRLVFLLEEPSARELLKGLLPRLVGEQVLVHYLVFEGKQDLETQLVRKLQGWQAPDSVFVVLRDQDAADCHAVKERLLELVARSKRGPVLVRVACHQLESWVAGDLAALALALEQPRIAEHARKEKFRNPDLLANPIDDLRQLWPEYQKVDGARRMGPRLIPESNASPSFRSFCSGVRRLLAEPLAR